MPICFLLVFTCLVLVNGFLPGIVFEITTIPRARTLFTVPVVLDKFGIFAIPVWHFRNLFPYVWYFLCNV